MSHQGSVTDLAFGSDGRYVATASDDGTARVWEARAGQEVMRVKHEYFVRGVAFSPDGKYFATGGLGSNRPGMGSYNWQGSRTHQA